MKTLIILALALSLTGCAGNNQSRLEILDAIATAAAKCEGEAGCIATLNAAIYSGAINQGQDSAIGIIGAFVPWLNVGLELTRIIYGGSGGSGQGFALNRSNNNTFIMPRTSSDHGSTTIAPFDSTVSVTKTQSWENMHNPWTDNSRDQVVK